MSSVDDRVVNMKFNNAQFQQAVAQTMSSLDALNKSLKLEGAAKGFEDLDKAGKSVQLGHISAAVDSIAEKFKALSIIGITALTNIVNKAVNAGTQIVKSLTVEPILKGLHEYEMNLNSIQTILANTQVAGVGLKEVNAALDELNHYSDQTIYNFSEMTKNIGTFTAAGVGLKDSVAAIKGIANLAALSGSNSMQASAAMYQLSQALAAGKVSLEDWNSVVNAGMGGATFQRALAQTAVAMGVINKDAVKLTGEMQNVTIKGESFRNSIMAAPGKESWLTSGVLINTLKQFTGDLTDAQIKAMGFNDAQVASIKQMAETAKAAATEVKTMTAVLDTAKEVAGSGWSETWRIVFGDFLEAKGLFTDLSNGINHFIEKSSESRNSVLSDWKELGGRTSLIYAIKNAFDGLVSVLTPIKQAFRQIFPATTAADLMRITTAIRMFTEKLTIGGQTADKIQRTFAGFFAVLAIGWDILKAVVGTIFDLLGVVAGGSGGFLEMTASLGDFLVGVRVAIQQGELIEKVFKKIGQVLRVPIELIQKLADFLSKLFGNFDGLEAADKLAGVAGKLSPLANIGDKILSVWSRLPVIFGEALDKFLPFAKNIGEFFTSIMSGAGELTDKLDFTKIFGGAGAAIFLSVLLAIRNVIANFGGAGGDILEGIKDSFDELNDTLGAMQNTLRAATLLQIAAAVGVLTLSVVALSKIDADGLTRALTAISVMFTQLFASMYVFEKFMSVSDIPELIALGAGMILLATAINILATAVGKLAELKWDELARGLTGVVTLLGGLVLAMKFMPNPAGLISTSAGLVILAAAIRLLVTSVEALSGLDWEELAKGLVGVGALLGALILFTKFAGANAGGVLQGAGIILLAAGIKILVSAVKDFAEMSWMEIARGITVMAGALAAISASLKLIPPTAVLSAAGVAIFAVALGLIADAMDNFAEMSWMEIARGMVAMSGAIALIAAALYLIPPTSLLSAAAVLVVAASLGMIADALKDMGKMSWEEIAKGLLVLAGSLLIISVAMIAMEGALLGAAALLVVAASLAVLAPVLLVFSKMSWEEMLKGLLMLAGALTVIGLAGLILQPVIPALLGLGAAVLLLGVGMLAAGAGVLLFSVALTALSVAGVAGTAALVGMVAALAGLIPVVLTKLGEGIVAFANVIATAGPAFTAAITAVLNAIIDSIVLLTPKIIGMLVYLLDLMLDTLQKNLPKWVQKGFDILISFLKGIRDNIGKVNDVVTQIIVNFIDGLGRNLPKIVAAGVNFVITFINSLADTIRKEGPRMGEAGGNLATAIVEGMVRGIAAGGGKIADAARNAAKRALDAAKAFLGIKSPSKEFEKIGRYSDEGFAQGLTKFAHVVEDSAVDVGDDAINALKKSLRGMAKLVDDNIDTNPTIRPVLDLSDIRKNASTIDRVLAGSRRISLEATRSTAKVASDSSPTNRDNDRSDPSNVSSTGDTYNYTQNISSPKAVSASEIYRNTNNMLSVKKGALTKPNA